MNLKEIREYVNLMMDRDKLGDPITGKQFNVALKAGLYKFYHEEIEKLKANNFRNLDNSPLWALKKIFSYSVLNPTLPNDYNTFLYAEEKTTLKEVVMLSDIEFSKMKSNAIFDKNKIYINIDASGEISALPNNSAVEIVYLSSPTSPIYDYCINNDNDEEVYMEDDWYIVKTIPDVETVWVLYNGDDEVLITGITYPEIIPVITTTHNSTSVEITEIKEQYHTLIGNSIVSLLAASENEQFKAQYTEAIK